ncbi:TIGR02221 family CRISPR-associated protein [Leptothermofonsia sichuanensis E412]|uniref:TIGR02221 family CRISPR-associated protein n=1 Tax=Leptothermofonsia sichuanensis TaxID=2917832 RepID=UPI001CA68A8B|nr:TIGR02221 family CRISPR-associated protein [Leptothermofonsia sichuanensis]QZZ22892.1 TIGR02221 family CRISPR-associated protein [Leptothermofonsia sichuanensis E412]
MKLLTFLGTNPYSSTTYVWQDQEKKTEYVAAALAEFFSVETVQVFLTSEARAKHWEAFQQAVPQAKDIGIPSGQSEDELWQIFEAVVNSVESDETIILDVTHSFRSIPLFVFLAGIYLQKAQDVKIAGVYYGAYERDRERSPIFDLTPTLKFAEWLTATDKFLNTGSAKELGQLLSTIQQDFYRQGRQNQEPIVPRKLREFGDRIQAISDSIELVRPLKLMEETARLEGIPDETLKTEVGMFAQPFALLLNRIQADYSQFALVDPRPRQALAKQLALLCWYVDKSLSAQAILLSREWVVSALCVGLGRDYLQKSEREVIEQSLNQLVDWSKDKNRISKSTDVSALESGVTNLEDLSKLWSQLRDMRNDLAHTEMRQNSLSASDMTRFVREDLLTRLRELFRDLNQAETQAEPL